MLLWTSRVQTELANTFFTNVNEKYRTDFKIDKVAISFGGNVQLQGFYCKDHHGDTLFYAKELTTSMKSLRKMMNNEFEFDRIALAGAKINIVKYEGEVRNSLDHFLTSLKSTEERKKNSATFSAKALELAGGTFCFMDQNKEAKAPTFVKDLSLNLKAFEVVGGNINGYIQNLHFNSNKGNLEGLTARVAYTPNNLQLTDLAVASGNNQLEGAVSLQFQREERANNFYDDAIWNVVINRSQWDISSLKGLDQYVGNAFTVQLQGRARGTLNALQFDSIKMVGKEDALIFEGSFKAKNMFKEEGRGFDLSIDRFRLDDDAIWKKLWQDKPEISNLLANISPLNFKGRAGLDADERIQFDVHAETGMGTLNVQGNMESSFSEKENDAFQFDAKVAFENLVVGKELNLKTPVRFSGVFELSGNGKSKKVEQFRWDGEDIVLGFENFTIAEINTQGLITENAFTSSLESHAEQLKTKLVLEVDRTQEREEYCLEADVEHLDLSAFGIALGGGKAIVQGKIQSDFKGNSLDALTGSIQIAPFSLTNVNGRNDFAPIKISQSFQNRQTQLLIESEDIIDGRITGHYRISQLQGMFRNALQEVYTFLPYDTSIAADQELRFNFRIYNKLLDALYPGLFLSKDWAATGKISSEKATSQLSFDFPLLRYNNFEVENIHFQLDTNNPLYNTFLSVGQLKHPKYAFQDLNMISTTLKDTLFFRAESKLESKTERILELNFYHVLDAAGLSHFGIKKSELQGSAKSWTLNPLDLKEEISFNARTGKLEIKQLTLEGEGAQSILIKGAYENPETLSVYIDAKDVSIANILSKPNFKLKGKANVAFDFERSQQRNTMALKSTIEALEINNQHFGTMALESEGNTQLHSYLFDFSIEDVLIGSGSLLGIKAPIINVDLSLNNLSLTFLSSLGKGNVTNVRGLVTGDINIWGDTQKEWNHNGTLEAENLGLSIPYLDVTYTIPKSSIRVHDQTLDFTNTTLVDATEETEAVLKGSVSHQNLKSWTADLSIVSDRLLILNKKQEENTVFFGKGYLDGEALLKGPFENLLVEINGATDAGTSIKIPWSEDYGLADISFINFVDKNRQQEKKDSLKVVAATEIRGLEMAFELDVTEDAEIEIVIDQESGSYLSGKGVGSIFMEVNTRGKFNMWGDFITSEGIYNFKDLRLVDKKFKVERGGTIVWEGDPLGAQMDIEAVYEVPGGANPALLLDNPDFNKKIPTNVRIRLEGNLLKPNDPVFEIDFVNVSGAVASEISYRLSDPQRTQLQALSLLSQGIFINEVGVSMEGIANNLYEKASDVFSNLLGEDEDKLKVGVNYLQGNKSLLSDIGAEDRLGLTLSTQISDRILLNGRIGVPVGGVDETVVVGDVQIDFILNEENTLKAKVFNKENEFRYIGDALGYTQGVGLSYQVDFNSFRELIGKIINNPSKN